MTARTTKTPKARDDNALKTAVAKAALTHIPFDGFTDKTLAAAAADAGVEKKLLPRLFPGGPLDLVRHRENGYLYPPDDTHQLHGAVRQLVEGPAVRRQMSVAARRSVEGRGWDVLGEQLVAHYQQVLGRRARPRRVA